MFFVIEFKSIIEKIVNDKGVVVFIFFDIVFFMVVWGKVVQGIMYELWFGELVKGLNYYFLMINWEELKFYFLYISWFF